MKLVVFIAVHKNQDQVNRLIRSLAHPDIAIYVHIDRKSIFRAGDLLPQARVISNPIEVSWSGYSQVESTLKALREILEREGHFDYVTYISGQDYPIMTPDAILTSLKKFEGKELIGHVTLDSQGWEKARVRFERFYFHSYENPYFRAVGRLVTFFLDGSGVKRSFYRGMKPYGGSAWWTLSRACIVYILDYIERNRGFVSFMKKTIFPDEIFFQSVIMNSRFRNDVVNNNFRFMEWERIKENSHPKILTMGDFSTIVTSGMFFARKFDIDVDKGILDRIDAHLLRQ